MNTLDGGGEGTSRLGFVEEPKASKACAGVKRNRIGENDEIVLDNYHCHKRYLTEVMASSLNCLRMAEDPSTPLASRNAPLFPMDYTIFSPILNSERTPSGSARSASPFPSHGDEAMSTLDSPMSSDSEDSVGFRGSTRKHLPPENTSSSSIPIQRGLSPSRHLADPTDGRLPPSPSDPNQSLNLRRAALLRSLQMRKNGSSKREEAGPSASSAPPTASPSVPPSTHFSITSYVPEFHKERSGRGGGAAAEASWKLRDEATAVSGASVTFLGQRRAEVEEEEVEKGTKGEEEGEEEAEFPMDSTGGPSEPLFPSSSSLLGCHPASSDSNNSESPTSKGEVSSWDLQWKGEEIESAKVNEAVVRRKRGLVAVGGWEEGETLREWERRNKRSVSSASAFVYSSPLQRQFSSNVQSVRMGGGGGGKKDERDNIDIGL